MILAFGWVASFFLRVVLRLAFILRNVTAALAAATGVNGVAQTASSIAALRLPRCPRVVEFLLLATRCKESLRRRPAAAAPGACQSCPQPEPNSGGAWQNGARSSRMRGRGEVSAMVRKCGGS